MKMPKWLLSKWLYYGLIALALLVFIFYLLPKFVETGVFSPDVGINFYSEAWGLLFTLLLFVVLFDLRELFEWKSVEDRVKKKIGKQIHVIFVELSHLCEVDSVLFGDLSDEAWKRQSQKQLTQLVSGKIELNSLAKELLEKRDLALNLASFFDNRRAHLSEIEDKYLKFLDSKLQSSLMDIQDYLERLRFDLRVFGAKKEGFYNSLSDVIGKIMKEIAEMRQNKIDIGF